MRRPKLQKYEPPKVGDYVPRQYPAFGAFGFEATVELKTGALTEERVTACATLNGARRLAQLLNDARDLAACWRDISTEPMHPGGNPEHWARIKIAMTVCKLLGINATYDFGASTMGMPVIGPKPEDSDTKAA